MRTLVVAASSVAFVALGWQALAATSGNSTSGACSPIIASAQSVTISGCGLSDEKAKLLQASINRTIKQNNFTQAQIETMVGLLNTLVSQSVNQEQKLDRIIIDLEGPYNATRPSPKGAVAVIRDTLQRTVQKIDNLKITITSVEAGAGRISIYFDVVNEGVVEYRNIDVFGGGSFGNGGSSIILKGQEVLATAVSFAGNSNRGLVRVNIVPQVHYNGRVDFSGVYGTADDVEIFKLALSNNNLRPSDRAIFRLGLGT